MAVRLLLFTASAAAAAAVAHAARAQQLSLRLSNVFSNGTVLQRGGGGAMLWGWATPGATVSVDGLGPGGTNATAGADGLWRVRLPPQPAGGPFTLQLSSSAGDAVTLRDVLFGDVLLCGGQSNQQFTVRQAFNASAELAAADAPAYDWIRVMTVGEGTSSATPLAELGTILQPWTRASSASLGVGNWSAFSALCWFAGRDVFNALNATVPIGLLSNNWGGTTIQHWMPSADVTACPGGSGPPGPNTTDGTLWNAMVAPYTVGPMATAGVLWDQGEANASGESSDGVEEWERYGCLFRGMVAAWRAGLGPGPDGGPLWFSTTQLQPWNAPPAYNGVFSGLRQQQVADLPPRVTFASAVDLGDPTSPFGPVHFRQKQAIGSRHADALLATLYGNASAPAGSDGPFYPRGAQVSGGICWTDVFALAELQLDPGTVSPQGIWTTGDPPTPCPVGGRYNFSADSCAWPTIFGPDGAPIVNATVIPTASTQMMFFFPNIFAGDFSPPYPQIVGGRPSAAAYGMGVWPMLTLYDMARLTPVLPFHANSSQTAAQGMDGSADDATAFAFEKGVVPSREELIEVVYAYLRKRGMADADIASFAAAAAAA